MLRVEARGRPHRACADRVPAGPRAARFRCGPSCRYAARKAAHGWLDFDDLILRAQALLTDPAVAQWVLFRLDGGIDHILVDEAQDTSPAQWAVIELLAAGIHRGAAAAGPRARSLSSATRSSRSIPSRAPTPRPSTACSAFRRKPGAGGTPLKRPLRAFVPVGPGDPAAGGPDLSMPHGRRATGRRRGPHRLSRPDAGAGGPLAADRKDPADDPRGGDWTDPVDPSGPEHHAGALARHRRADPRLICAGGLSRPDGGNAAGDGGAIS
jgi:ATP-dependent helicase/nuclease subunit A